MLESRFCTEEGLFLKKTQILLSTYNGEEHLREQLDSLLSLDGAESITLLIRDDGSTDKTRVILAEYEKNERIRVLYGENVGLNASMQILFNEADSTCSYYAYADQDDVWLKSKLSRAVHILDEGDNTLPTLYAARSYLTDASGNIIGQTRLLKHTPCFSNAMVQNVCIGHTQVYNRAMLDLLRTHYHKDVFVIDHWAYLLACALGRVVFDNALVALYRQHGKNTIGYAHNLRTALRNRLRRALAGVPRRHAKQLRAIDRVCGARLCVRDRRELSLFLSSRRSIFTRLCYLLRARAHMQSFFENLGFRVLYLFGCYNEKRNE